MKTPLSGFVEERLVARFAREEREEARKRLVEECGENIPGWNSAGLDRLRCGALKVSDGDLQKLRRSVEWAKRDFGDPDSYRSWKPGKKRR